MGSGGEDKNPENIGKYCESFYLCVFICVSWGPFNNPTVRRRALGSVGGGCSPGSPGSGAHPCPDPPAP
eukprot:3797513-Pyramimonas_sp.AAC.1